MATIESKENVKVAVKGAADAARTAVKAVGGAAKETASKTKAAAKETAAKTKAAKKKSTPRTRKAKVQILLQFGEDERDVTSIEQRVRDDWKEKFGGRGKSIRSLNIYLKPEDQKAYWVINDRESGSVDL